MLRDGRHCVVPGHGIHHSFPLGQEPCPIHSKRGPVPAATVWCLLCGQLRDPGGHHILAPSTLPGNGVQGRQGADGHLLAVRHATYLRAARHIRTARCGLARAFFNSATQQIESRHS